MGATERVPAADLAAGDVIEARHCHVCKDYACTVNWSGQVSVVAVLSDLSDYTVVVEWRVPATKITGASVYHISEQVTRTGHTPTVAAA